MADRNSQQFVQIDQFFDSMVRLKDGSFRSMISVDSVNFDLKSQDEQTAIILHFQSLLNALDFPLQIMIYSRELDLDNYLADLGKRAQVVKNELIRIQLIEYQKFVQGLLELSNIMTKSFYVVVPVFPNILASKKRKKTSEKKDSEKTIDVTVEKNQIIMNQRVNLILNQFSGFGINGKVLTKNELVNIFYAFYNPGSKEAIVLDNN